MKRIKKWSYTLWVVSVGVVVLMALLLTSLRLLTPYLNRHHDWMTEMLAKQMGMNVQVESIHADWSGLHPALRLSKVRLSHHKTEVVIIDRLRLQFAILPLLIHKEFRLLSFRLRGVRAQIPPTLMRLTSRIDTTALLSNSEHAFVQLMQWLNTQRSIRMVNSQLSWKDAHAKSHVIKIRFLRQWRYRNRQYLMSKMRLDNAPVQIRMKAWPPFNHHADYQLYAIADRLQLHTLFPTLQIDSLHINQASGNVQLWINAKQGNIHQADVVFKIPKLKLQHPMLANLQRIRRADGHLRWQQSANGQWTLWGDALHLDHDNKKQARHFRIDYRVGAATSQPRYHFVTEDVSVAHLQQWFNWKTMEHHSLNVIKQADLTAHFPQVAVDYFPLDKNFSLQGVFDQADFKHNKMHTHWKNFAGKISGDHRTIHLWLDAKGAHLVQQELQQTLDLKRLTGALQLNMHHKSMQLMGNIQAVLQQGPDIQARFFVKQHGDQPAYIGLLAKAPKVSVQNAKALLPHKWLTPRFVEWINGALLAGELSDLKVMAQGSTNHFPYPDHRGHFSAQFSVNNGSMQYYPKWPALSDINANVYFTADKLLILASDARLNGANVQYADILVESLAKDLPASVHFNTQVKGTLVQGRRFIEQSPLKAQLHDALHPFEFAGPLNLKLQSTIGLSAQADKTSVKGELDLNDARVKLPQWGAELSHLKGQLTFDTQQVNAKQLQFSFLGHPATASLSTEQSAKGRQFIFDMLSSIDAHELKAPILQEHISGSTPYQLKITHGDQQTTVNLQSTLSGLTSILPEPFAKTSDQDVPLKMQLDWKNTKPQTKHLAIHLGDRARAKLSLQSIDSGQQLQAGLIQLGRTKKTAKLPKEGLTVSGDLKILDIDKWYKLSKPWLGENTSQKLALQSVNLAIGKLLWSGYELNDAKVKVGRNAPFWLFNINSSALSGEVWLPDDNHVNDVVLNFSRCDWFDQFMRGSSHNKMLNLPSLKARCKRVYANNVLLGDVSFNIKPQSDFTLIEDLNISGKDYQLKGNGRFDQSSTELSGQVVSPDVGDALEHLGFKSNLVGNHGKINYALHWPGTPLGYALDKLKGSVNMHLRDGHLLKVEPGMGRMLTALSLESINRRFKLGLKDFFEKGMAVDSIKGSISLDHGLASTRDMILKGPSAMIELKGNTHFIKQSYDVKVKITPHLTSSLPLAAALAVANPAVGAAVWLVDKAIISPKISEMTRFEYHVTGTWQSPNVQLIKEG